ncbi:restriction endonuclease subunit S [Sulfurospirillum cavolei]|uniref:restriction endonuclease subunit S n=1 Tax=Sulfurospirillum cavolei TaxID=366522 RepID=UPI0005AA768A|nr:restriction endonuclease subunit S [Sulfurospirillum cavolei]
MSKYQPYPQYKDSGVEWLGEVPEHWEVKRLKYFTTVNDETLSEKYDEDFEINYIDIGSVTTGYIQNSEVILYSDAPSRARRIVREGDILVSTVRTYLKAIAPVSHSENGYIASTGFAVIRSRNDVCSDYLKYALLSNYFINLVESESTGISYPAINASELVTFNIALAPFEEQQVVANFLDNATCKIDTLIQKQQNLIELLKEKRQALISHAVTKGLNPHVKMKDSGVEWLGEVPEHWETERLKYVCQITTGNKDTENKEDCGEYPFYVRSQTIERINSYSYDGEAILTAGDGVGVGKVFHYVNGKFDYHQRVYMFYKFSKVKGKYLFEYMKNNLYKVALEGGAKSTVDSLRLPLLQNFMITVPPPEEQQDIIFYLNNATCKIDTLIAKAQQAIELLKERRTALISAVVTGKIDVRSVHE